MRRKEVDDIEYFVKITFGRGLIKFPIIIVNGPHLLYGTQVAGLSFCREHEPSLVLTSSFTS